MFTISGPIDNTNASPYTITVHAYDYASTAAQHGSDTFTLTLMANLKPTRQHNITNVSVVARETLHQTITDDTFIDPEGKALTYTYTISSTPANGLITVDTTSLAWFNVDGDFTNADADTYTVTITANDPYYPGTDSTSYSFDVTITENKGPTNSTTIPSISKVARNGTTNALPAVIFTDPEGDPMTFSSSVNTTKSLITVDLSANTYTLISTTTNSDVAVYRVTLTANDPYSDTTQGTTYFDITVTTNDGPVHNNAVTNGTVVAGQQLNEMLPNDIFTEPNGDAMTYSFSVSPSTTLINVDITTLSYYNVSSTSDNDDVDTYIVTLTAKDPYYPDTDERTYSFNVDITYNFGPIVNVTVDDFSFSCERMNLFTHTAYAFKDLDNDNVYFDGSFSPLAPFLTYDNTTRTISGNPADGDNNTYVFTLKAYNIHAFTTNVNQTVSNS
jgi:hypothetical protein